MKGSAHIPVPGFGAFRAMTGVAALAVAALFAASSEAQDAGAARRLRVAVAEFAKLSGNARFDFLQAGIPGVLGSSLLAKERLAPIGPGALSATLARHGLSSKSRFPLSEPRRELAQDIDYVLQGSYFEFQGRLVLNASLVDVRTNREFKLGQVTMDEKRIVPGIEAMAASVVAALEKQGEGARTRSLAVSCFDDRSPAATEASRLVRRDLALFLTGELGARRGVRVAEWAKVEKTCDNPLRDNALARQLDVDAIISGWFSVENDTLRVFLMLYIREYDARFELPKLEGPVARYLQLKVELGRKVDATLSGALGSEGEWRIAELGRTTQPEENLRRGRELYEKGDLDLATLHLERAAASGSAPDAHYYLGLVQSKQRKFEQAAANLEHYVKLRPQSGAAHRALGLAYAGLRKYDAAIAAYERALMSDPNVQGVYVEIGNVYFFQGKFDDARRYYLEAVKREPDDSAASFNLGLVAERQGNDGEAIRMYRNALRINSKDANARRSLAWLHHKRGEEAYDKENYTLAISEFTEEIASQPAAPGYYGRAVSRAFLALQQPKPDYGEAIRDYEEAVRRSAGVAADSWYRRSALMNLTESYILSERFGEAREQALQTVKETRDDPRDRRISRYLLIASQVLSGADYITELALLRRDIADAKDKISGWNFAMLDRFYRESASISEQRRGLLLEITREFKGKAIARER